MNRAQAIESLAGAQLQFRHTMWLLPKWMRNAASRAVRQLARVQCETDVSKGQALEELASLIDRAEPPPAVSSSRPSLRPDREGDEDLLERRGHVPSGARHA